MDTKYEKKIEVVSSHINRTNTTSIIWFLSMLVIWFSGLLITSSGWHKYDKSMGSSQYKIELKMNAKEVKFRLPGLEFEIPSKYAPTAWNYLMLLFVIFAYISKEKTLTYAARAIKFGKDNCPNSKTELHIMSPWWLAPMPKIAHENKKVTPNEMLAFFSWGENHTLSNIKLWAFLGVILLLQVHVAWLATLSNDIYVRGGSAIVIMPTLSFVSVVLTVLISAIWLRSSIVPSQKQTEKSPEPITKRDFLITSFSLILAGIFAPIREIYRTVNLIFTPRYRRRKAPIPTKIDLKPGLWVNHKTSKHARVIHVVSGNQDTYIFGNSPNLEHFKRISLSNISNSNDVYYFNGTRGLNQLEQFIIKELVNLQKKPKLAIDLLIIAMKYDQKIKPTSTGRPSYRIYDLAAGLSVFNSEKEKLNQIIKIASKSGDDRLLKKAAKWRESKSEWRDKWSSSNDNLKWAGIPMKRS